MATHPDLLGEMSGPRSAVLGPPGRRSVNLGIGAGGPRAIAVVGSSIQTVRTLTSTHPQSPPSIDFVLYAADRFSNLSKRPPDR